MYNLAVIGSFWLCEEFIKAVKSTPGVRYYAQYSRDIEKARELGAKNGAVAFYDDLSLMAEDPEVDIVYIASPNKYHYEQSKLFLSKGKHVLCEKPAAPDGVAYRQLCGIADSNRVIYAEAMLNIHIEWAHSLKKALGEAGAVICARFDFNQRSSKLEKVKNNELVSSFSKELSGGALNDLGVYAASLAAFLFGKPESVYARATFKDNGKGADVIFTAVLGYQGFSCVITSSKLAQSAAGSEIICENDVFTMSNLSQLQNLKQRDNEGKYTLMHGTNSFPESMTYELEDFLSYINGDKEGYALCRSTTTLSLDILSDIRESMNQNR